MSSPLFDPRAATLSTALAVLMLAACSSRGIPPGDSTQQPQPAPAGTHGQGTGPDPELPEPRTSLIPTVDIAPAVGWAGDAQPTPSEGFAVNAFARDLDHPRTVYVLPNGDVLVAESNAPPQKVDLSLKRKAMEAVMKRAGAGVPSADRITLLRDADGDGVAETRTTFLEDLMSPFGIALVGDTLYVANADALVKVPYSEGTTRITTTPTQVAALPGGPLNHHWTKALLASPDGSRLYVGVGSNSNVGENGMEMEVNRAAILEVDADSGATRVFASGLRNPTALDWNPGTGMLWAVVNERDELGDNLVPDYLTSVRDGEFYGWPYSYFGQHRDPRIDEEQQRPDLVAKAVVPDYALGSHVAPLGLAFYTVDSDARQALPDRYRNGAFIGLHGSWNRSPKVGYKVVFVPFSGGRPAGPMEDILGGFVNADGEAQGRPVSVAVDAHGAVLVADDVGNAIWRITGTATP
ncbi:PQQ-dependent sugar dehydrogenase [Marilutibacter chinensis]|uniref:Sorbosone dehydrogenase family protein n=1 Tax=Marilutibacter chinensis TaxID=2912247 RepID=A0ABS9HPJ9_9GAMM|nr:sorbosone dehydrogenase family protein [Lysobacter chinensis]MCF7220866.1 sorbosone dehydrogenase family protein [Lysobacter chinensis]